MKYSKFASVFVFSSLFSLPVYAQQFGALEAEISALREDVLVLQREAYRTKNDNVLAPGSSGDAALKIGEMDETLRTINGKMDEINFKIKSLDNRLTLINRDIDIRLKMLEGAPIDSSAGGLGTDISAPQEKFVAPVAQGAPKSIVGDAVSSGNDLADIKTQSAAELYQAGLDALKANNSGDAERYFDSVLRRFPKDKLAANAQYWLGEVYYGQKNYKAAAKAFGDGLKNYKDGAKGADCLLKLGMSFVMMDDSKSACTAFTSLKTEFPKAPEDIKVRAAQEAAKLKSCK